MNTHIYTRSPKITISTHLIIRAFRILAPLLFIPLSKRILYTHPIVSRASMQPYYIYESSSQGTRKKVGQWPPVVYLYTCKAFRRCRALGTFQNANLLITPFRRDTTCTGPEIRPTSPAKKKKKKKSRSLDTRASRFPGHPPYYISDKLLPPRL